MPRPEAKEYVRQAISKQEIGQLILDAGAGEDPNYYEDLFPGKYYHKLDIEQNRAGTITYCTDIQCIHINIPIKYDVVLCLETLEHLPYPGTALRQLHDILKIQGLIVITTVACWGIHQHPKDYWRFLPDSMQMLLENAGYQVLDISLERNETISPCGIFATARKSA